jgi:hypothetical protein
MQERTATSISNSIQRIVIVKGARGGHIIIDRNHVVKDIMTHYSKFLPTIAAALVVTGCSAIFVEDIPGPRANYFDGDFEFATHKGAIVTVVAGNPFGSSKDQLDRLVRQDLDASVLIGTSKFVVAPGENTVAPFKVVVAFNTAPSISNSNLCALGANTPTVRQTGEVNVKMAFCDGDHLKSGSAAWVFGSSSVDDRKFRDLVKQAAVALLPLQDGEKQAKKISRSVRGLSCNRRIAAKMDSGARYTGKGSGAGRYQAGSFRAWTRSRSAR